MAPLPEPPTMSCSTRVPVGQRSSAGFPATCHGSTGARPRGRHHDGPPLERAADRPRPSRASRPWGRSRGTPPWHPPMLAGRSRPSARRSRHRAPRPGSRWRRRTRRGRAARGRAGRGRDAPGLRRRSRRPPFRPVPRCELRAVERRRDHVGEEPIVDDQDRARSCSARRDAHVEDGPAAPGIEPQRPTVRLDGPPCDEQPEALPPFAARRPRTNVRTPRATRRKEPPRLDRRRSPSRPGRSPPGSRRCPRPRAGGSCGRGSRSRPAGASRSPRTTAFSGSCAEIGGRSPRSAATASSRSRAA